MKEKNCKKKMKGLKLKKQMAVKFKKKLKIGGEIKKIRKKMAE